MATTALPRPRFPRFAVAIGMLVGLAVLLVTEDATSPLPYFLLASALFIAVYRYIRGPEAPWEGNDEP